MSKLGLLAVALVATALAVLAPAPHADVTHVTLDGVRVALHEHTRQVVTVEPHPRLPRPRRLLGRARRPLDAGCTPCATAASGTAAWSRRSTRHQGTGTTPLGDREADLGVRQPRPRARRGTCPTAASASGDYWVEDNGSRFYNRYRNKAQGGFRWWLPPSRRTAPSGCRDFPVQYEFSIVTSYNRDAGAPPRRRASSCTSTASGATAGCVSAPRPFLVRMMWRLDPAKVPVMAVGR